jgi:monoamine oxidase
VIEARDRAGGRVWPLAAVPGSWAELGAEFIHGSAPLTYELLREAKLTWDPTEGERWDRAPGGTLEREDDSFAADSSLFDALRDLPDDVSVAEYLERYRGDPQMRTRIGWALAFTEGFDAADPRIASARAIAAEWSSGVDDCSTRPRGTYRPLFDFLLETCTKNGARFHFSTVVERIEWSAGRVEIETRGERGARHRFRAKACVVTVPTGVLRHTGDATAIAFDPPLPAKKRHALELIETGDVVKAALWFRSRFWERIEGGRYRDAAFFRTAGEPFAVYWNATAPRDPIVTAWSAGPAATALLHVSEDALVERAVRGFGALFGDERLARDEFVAGAVHDWRDDPFARGAYSYLAVGAGDARAVLGAAVEGTLFFAGEATALHGEGGTVNGALESGDRAAREIGVA